MLRARLVAGAYAPMVFMIAVRLIEAAPWWSAVMAVTGALLVTNVVVLVLRRSELAPSPYELVSVKDENAQVPTYLITYLLPFVILDDVTFVDAGVYAIFLGLTLVLAARTSLVLVNPILLLMNLRLYEVETVNGASVLLLSSGKPRPGQVIHAVPFPGGGMKQMEIGQP